MAQQQTVYDVAIIGSGAGGGMAAYALTKAGVRVVMLEAGGEWYASKNSTMLMPSPLTVGAELGYLAPIAEITSSLDIVGVMLPGETLPMQALQEAEVASGEDKTWNSAGCKISIGKSSVQYCL